MSNDKREPDKPKVYGKQAGEVADIDQVYTLPQYRAKVSDLFSAPLPREEHAARGHATPVERREQIIEEAKARIFAGERLDEIAAFYGIHARVLDYWLAQLGEEYRQLRRAWIDSKLTSAEELIALAPTKFDLLKARELFKVAAFYAERRDPERYAPRQEVTMHRGEPTDPEQIRQRIRDLERKLGIRVVNEAESEEAEPVADPS